MTSLCLRAGVKAEEAARRLQQIDCRACTRAFAKGNGVEVRSCAAGVGKSISVLLGQRDTYQAMAVSLSNLDEQFPSPNKTGNNILPESAGGGISCPDSGSAMYAAEGLYHLSYLWLDQVLTRPSRELLLRFPGSNQQQLPSRGAI
ncbi:MAG: hypothetical protein COZ70_02520 [Deltaproteobacteria bacterium CG_4_8_14_3_um_filter_51_11]|nr:MAG: hypothetical protein COZ70_02520 [Deltaproteobacteria bacterium CG_4_8_14_3_um_filter_51_11]PIY22028.1 MAG: hypothetical protein COZ11_14185 [Deltaproteobacteria bacterium CG_4_10_14_3_um_filter_51_14]